MGKCFFIGTSPVLVFHAHTCLLIACLHTHDMLSHALPTHCMLAYSLHACILIIALASLHLHTYILTRAYFDTCILCTWMLSLFHLHWGTYSVHVVVQVWWKCQCVSVSVEVSVFKGFSGRTLRNAFGNEQQALPNKHHEWKQCCQ